MQAGQQMGQDYMMAAQAQAQGLYNQQMEMNQPNWGSLLGMGMGVGMGGGSGLFGQGMSGLGSLFSGAPSYESLGGLATFGFGG